MLFILPTWVCFDVQQELFLAVHLPVHTVLFSSPRLHETEKKNGWHWFILMRVELRFRNGPRTQHSNSETVCLPMMHYINHSAEYLCMFMLQSYHYHKPALSSNMMPLCTLNGVEFMHSVNPEELGDPSSVILPTDALDLLFLRLLCCVA